MKKDVIYIDIEDDITTVIDKVKHSTEKIIALVPPKGNAVLQSVVNLKLLKRAAEGVNKQLVIVTSNQSLTALAGGLELYIAKTLQSKPMLLSSAELSEATSETVEVSDEVGDLDEPSAHGVDDSDEMELSGEELSAIDDENAPKGESKKTKKDDKKKNKVPNFGSFRKKLFLIGGSVLVLLIVLLVVFGRTKASIAIRAETTPVDIAYEVIANANSSQSDFATQNLKAQSQERKKTLTQNFTATGEKDLGTKASGAMTFSIRCSDVDGSPPTIPAGTTVTANGLSFVTQSATNLTTPAFSPCRFSGNTTVTAKENGDKYNLSARSYTVSGFSSVSASGAQMSGGTSKIVKVISQADVDKATEQLKEQDTNAVRDELKKGFQGEVVVLDDSFIATQGTVTSEPAVGQEANDGRLSVEMTYSLLAVSQEDMNKSLDAFIVNVMPNKEQQQVYENGFSKMKLEKIDASAKVARYRVISRGQYGPKFDVENLKKEVSGKKIGEVRSYLQDLPGVKGVDINLTPFWARKLPNSNQITIELAVDENIGS